MCVSACLWVCVCVCAKKATWAHTHTHTHINKCVSVCICWSSDFYSEISIHVKNIKVENEKIKKDRKKKQQRDKYTTVTRERNGKNFDFWHLCAFFACQNAAYIDFIFQTENCCRKYIPYICRMFYVRVVCVCVSAAACMAYIFIWCLILNIMQVIYSHIKSLLISFICLFLLWQIFNLFLFWRAFKFAFLLLHLAEYADGLYANAMNFN